MTSQDILDVFEIEKIEKDILLKFGWLFKNSLDEFSTSVDRSLGYLDKIILPTIMASKQDKSYNPFSEIIEKYAIHILTHKLEKEGYKLLPLGYSADLTLENKDHILSIDIKTANLDNPSDFRKTINVGINQMTHIAKLRINREFLPGPFFVYPTIPPYYKFPDGRIKLILTYGLLFIYPSYSDLVREIRQDYTELFEFFGDKVRKALIPILVKLLRVNEKKAEQILKSKPKKSRYTREELIAESVIRGIFIHEQERDELLKSLDINSEDKKIIETFSEKLKEFTNKLRERDVKPIAIIAIAIPNGLLKEKYLDKFVSGKNYSKSARYHYEDGIFEIIKEKTGDKFPRVLFLDVNEEYLSELKRYFDEIVILDYQLKRV
ncbi:hypothetical protein ADU37_CDS02950 [Thermococcus sp. 2319x1]|uniref:hypothetical protein n=1 Tax=Thermococcus sp. 2319x1 TaxID=1674923 RepID=UPI00073A658D|nr:hypothetical protein [Thermococcus sp. 2319x1]ALV61994.1 hypothetical protein ADU37_CDS02950 [Thermococcus sp. 2319x1]